MKHSLTWYMFRGYTWQSVRGFLRMSDDQLRAAIKREFEDRPKLVGFHTGTEL